jgi:hypothetical protein
MPRPGRDSGPWNRTPTAASRGPLPYPGARKPAINSDNETATGLQDHNTPVEHRRLKSLVLGHNLHQRTWPVLALVRE